MAKDPAFLFYPNDWLGGTMGLTFEEKGCYIELLMMQFNKGKFTKAQAKQVLGICFSVAWANLEQKFRTDGTYYWNARLQKEQDKRIKFSESRRNNAKSTKKDSAYANTSAEHMQQHMENENIDENVLRDKMGVKGEVKGWNQMPGQDFLGLELPEITEGSVTQFMRLTSGKTPSRQDVLDLWDIFKKQNFTGKDFYATPEKTFSHFINWAKNQKINGTHQQQPNRSNPKTAGASKLLGMLKDDLRARGNQDIGGQI